MPILQVLLPIVPLLLEPLGGANVFHPRRDLALELPFHQALLAPVPLLPHELDLVESLVVRREAEPGEGRVDHEERQVGHLAVPLPEELGPLGGRQLDLGGLLVIHRRLVLRRRGVHLSLHQLGVGGVFLGLLALGRLSLALLPQLLHLLLDPLRALPGLLHCLLALLPEALPDALGLLVVELGQSLVLLFFQELCVHCRLVVGRRVAHQHPGLPSEMRERPSFERVHSVRLGQVPLHLHDDHVAALQGCRRGQKGLGRAVVQRGDAEAHLWPVVRGLLHARVLRSPQAAP
mmetsp:Transcript_2977/g.8983  ORF Transcript_2977/g.8983 Transcript_2977/m.8983 type:complete len:291 (-) Transcript_2977:1063-1935(-)